MSKMFRFREDLFLETEPLLSRSGFVGDRGVKQDPECGYTLLGVKIKDPIHRLPWVIFFSFIGIAILVIIGIVSIRHEVDNVIVNPDLLKERIDIPVTLDQAVPTSYEVPDTNLTLSTLIA